VGSVRVSAFAGLAAAAAAGLVTVPASAVEQQHHLGLGPQLAILSIKDKTTASVGGGGAVHYAYGLTDQWNITGELSAAIVAAKQRQDFPTAPLTRPAEVDQASAGMTYVIDILRWVPYIGAEVGLYRLAGGTLPSVLLLPGAALGAGLDFQFTRHFAAGVGVREHFLFTKLSTYPSYTTVLFRFEVMWGY
jgi:hypothetical protein